LEALVFGARIAAEIAGTAPATAGQPKGALPTAAPATDTLPEAALTELRRIMTADVGVERDEAGLTRALRAIARIEREERGASRALLNMLTAATLVAAAALRRTESRGGHARADHPQIDPAQAHQTLITLDEALAIRAKAEETAP
jgi:L-aspartate oxidase